MANYVASKGESEILERVYARMRKKGIKSPKYMIQMLEYLEDELDAAEASLAETEKKTEGLQPDVSDRTDRRELDLSFALNAIKRLGWKPFSISFADSGTEITLE